MSRHTGPFGFIPEWLFRSHVSGQAKLLYVALTFYADFDNDEAWPSRRTLAETLGCSRRTINRALTELVECGAIKRSERRRHDGSQTSNAYFVVRKSPSWVPPVTPPVDMGDTPPVDMGDTP